MALKPTGTRTRVLVLQCVVAMHVSISQVLQSRFQVIEEAESHKGLKKDLCVKFGITPSTLSTFLKNKEKIRSQR